MKRTVAFILAFLMCLSAVSVTGISVFAETEEARYSVVLYEDSTMQNPIIEKHNLKEGDMVSITFEPTKEGYEFVSWVDAKTGEKVSFNNDVIVVGTESVEYYIEWSINSYKLIYRGYSDAFEEYDVVYGTPAEDMPVPSGKPVREGYEFIEWSALPATMPAQKTNIVARWRDVNLEAHFYVDYGDTKPYLSVSLLYGDPIFEPSVVPVKTGYTFKGWSLDGENVVSEYELGNIGDEDKHIYAVWEANKYNATFLANGGKFADGSDKKVVSVAYNSQIEFNETPTKDYAIFNGWTPAVGIMNNTNGINFRATWITMEDTYYSVETYVMGTDGKYYLTSSVKIKGTVGETVTAGYIQENGFELNKTKSKLTGVVTTDCSLVLKVYLARSLYDFYINVDGVVTEETYLYGETLPTPASPEKEGYVFIGWSPFVPAKMPARDYTVTAMWKKVGAPDHAHSGKQVKIDPTCTQTGKIYTVCDICDEVISDVIEIAATGHTEGDWTVVIEPTYDAPGKKVKKCITCGETVDEASIAKLDKPSSGDSIFSNTTVEIRNNPGLYSLKYGETLRVYADAKNIPSTAKLEWTVSGEGAVITKSEGNMCEVQAVSDGSALLTVTVVDSNGEAARNDSGKKISDSQYISVKAGFIQRIIAFFKKLFGLDKIIVQMFNNI